MTADVKQRLKGENVKETKDGNASKDTKEHKPKYWDPLIEGVKWIEKYSEPMEKLFAKIPNVINTFIATLAIFTFGSTLRGEWVVILVTALKQFSGHTKSNRNVTTQEIFSMFTESNMKLENFGVIFIAAHVVAYTMYFAIGGFLHWYFYMNRRHLAKEWKLQPNKWLSPELERHEIMVGTVSLFVTGSFSAFLACYIYNENPSSVYYQFDEYGWLWFFLQFPVIFLYMKTSPVIGSPICLVYWYGEIHCSKDYVTFVLHRLYHTPYLYKNFHKLHHKYHQPTVFSVTAIHPVEIMHIQLTLCLPLFVIPCHWVPYFMIAFYNYYHGIIDHSGINFKAQWWQPWQPDAEFHDKHHEFFHCNFGFNMSLWDKLHGTARQIDRVYTEDTYVGEAPLIDSPEGKALLSANVAQNGAETETNDLNGSK